jgi:hypothetical protein
VRSGRRPRARRRPSRPPRGSGPRPRRAPSRARRRSSRSRSCAPPRARARAVPRGRSSGPCAARAARTAASTRRTRETACRRRCSGRGPRGRPAADAEHVRPVDLRDRLGTTRRTHHQGDGLAALLGQPAHGRLGQRREIAGVLARAREPQLARLGPHRRPAAVPLDEPVALERLQREADVRLGGLGRRDHLGDRARRALEHERQQASRAVCGIDHRGPQTDISAAADRGDHIEARVRGERVSSAARSRSTNTLCAGAAPARARTGGRAVPASAGRGARSRRRPWSRRGRVGAAALGTAAGASPGDARRPSVHHRHFDGRDAGQVAGDLAPPVALVGARERATKARARLPTGSTSPGSPRRTPRSRTRSERSHSCLSIRGRDNLLARQCRPAYGGLPQRPRRGNDVSVDTSLAVPVRDRAAAATRPLDLTGLEAAALAATRDAAIACQPRVGEVTSMQRRRSRPMRCAGRSPDLVDGRAFFAATGAERGVWRMEARSTPHRREDR